MTTVGNHGDGGAVWGSMERRPQREGTAHPPQPGADGNRLAAGFLAAEAFWAAFCAQGAVVAELVRYVKWAGWTKGASGAQDSPVSGPRPQGGAATEQGAGDCGGQVEEDAGGSTRRGDLDGPRERGRRPIVQMLEELVQRERRY